MEAADSSETSVTFHKTTWLDNLNEALFQLLLYRQARSVFEYEWGKENLGMEMIQLQLVMTDENSKGGRGKCIIAPRIEALRLRNQFVRI
jgi:hypothetical protein